MPRKARRKSRTGIYHIMLRGVNRQTIFEEEEDRIKFLETLKKYKNISKYQLYSYCLMDNHVHLLLKEVEETLSVTIKRISSSYVHWYNHKYNRSGHLFQERFKSEPVENHEYFLTVLRYIHQNPLKAGLAKNVWDSEWTSIQEYVHQKDSIDIEFGLHLFSTNNSKAIQMFIEYMQQPNDDQCLDDQIQVKTTDIEVRAYLHQLGITHSSQLQQMNKENRNAILADLKNLEGTSLRQLARITGIAKSVIQRVR